MNAAGEGECGPTKTISSSYDQYSDEPVDEWDQEQQLAAAIYEIIDPVVSRTDDTSLPVLTFRVWFIGLLLGTLLCVSNAIFSFRTNEFTATPLVAVLVSYPLGLLMSKVLPKGVLNPGDFNYKEHACIYIFAFVMGNVPYGVLNVICQRYLLYQKIDMPLSVCFAFVVATQCLGLGIAGCYRRILVRPAAMVFPEVIAPIAMLNSFHKNDDDSYDQHPMSRFKFFWIVASIMALYQFFPGFIAPMLGAVSVLCWFVKDRLVTDLNYRTMMMLGSSQSLGGVGFLSFTFDWSVISAFNPITTPLWATLNLFFGLYLSLWVAVPILWKINAFGMDQQLGSLAADGPNGTGIFPLGFALNAAVPFDKYGGRVKPREFLQRDPNDTFSIVLNATKYDLSQPIHVTTYAMIGYFCSFMVMSSSLVHVLLWYGKDVFKRICSAKPDSFDVHASMMDVYAPVPDWWYAIVLCLSATACTILCTVVPAFRLDWWATLCAVLFALVMTVPLGMIQAISGHNIGLNIVSEFFLGYLCPGRVSSILAFKTISYQAQNFAIALASVFKFGSYVKIPPRSMFLIVLVASVVGAVASTATAMFIYEFFGYFEVTTNALQRNGDDLKLRWKIERPNFAEFGWSYYQYARLLSEGVIMGAIGPAKFFQDSPQYLSMVYGLAAGLVLPIIPWILDRMYPYGYWHLVNIPIIAAFPAKPNAMRSDLITPLLVAIIVNYFVKKYRPFWWRKYAYVLSAGFDTGASFTLLILFLILLCFRGIWNTTVRMPYWILNPADMDGCAPWFYLTCKQCQKWDSSVLGGNKPRSSNGTRDWPSAPGCEFFQAGRQWPDS
ncbi:OPT oligopeptide transporter protein-domain-containing protein [Obelidium mucronatum]|nr:OPT oligopeptide transporter protein-domain-containing protein [Obelidium mucronatum]